MTTSQKIEKLNEACKGDLEIIYFIDNWELTTYTVLKSETFKAPTFDAVVDKAFRFVFSKQL